MTDDTTNRLILLRTRMAWFFQLVRIVAVIWACWIFVRLMLLLWDRPTFLRNLSAGLMTDLSDVSLTRYMLAFAVASVVYIAAMVLSAFIWRLFGSFIAGRLFTVDTARQVRAVAIAGFVATLIDIAYRPIFYVVLRDGLIAKVPWNRFVISDDLLHLLLAAMVLAFANVFRTAAERSRPI